jgi:hypothetical protein
LLRKRLPVAAMALAILITSIESSQAQLTVSLPEEASVELRLPDSDLRASVPPEAEPTWPTLLEMKESTAVMATEMLLVSVMVEKIESARTPKGARRVAQELAKEKYGWGSYQFSCLNTLWTKESHWNYRARNKRTGAHGIPQALPATKMEIISSDWRTNPVTQIQWGLHYIDVRYQTPCRALAKFKRSRYY